MRVLHSFSSSDTQFFIFVHNKLNSTYLFDEYKKITVIVKNDKLRLAKIIIN